MSQIMKVSDVNKPRIADQIDATLLRALVKNPEATNLAIAETTGLARNTVRARLTRYAEENSILSFERRIDPSFLGYPLRAFIITKVKQRQLSEISATLARVPEVLEVFGLSGAADFLIHVVARDSDDLYRIAGRILAIDGVKRTTTGLVMNTSVEYRISQLIGDNKG